MTKEEAILTIESTHNFQDNLISTIQWHIQIEAMEQKLFDWKELDEETLVLWANQIEKRINLIITKAEV